VQEYIIKNKEKAEAIIKKVNEYRARAEEYAQMYAEYKAKIEEGVEKAEKIKGKFDQGLDVLDQYTYNDIAESKMYASTIKHQDNMAFAMALSLPDGGTDVNGTFIIPKQLSMFCDNLSSKDALKEDAVNECLVRLNEERRKEQSLNPYDAPKVMRDTMVSFASVMVADSIKLVNDAEGFEKNFVEPVQYAPDTNKTDTYANIIELAKGIDLQMNTLLKIYSTKLALKTIINYQNYMFRNFTEEELANLKVADSIGKDDGTSADGIFIIPRRMALTCGLDSETALDLAKLDKCKTTLANITEEEGFNVIRDEILHQLNKNKLEVALNLKSQAGDYEDIQTEVVNGGFKAKEGSPAMPEGKPGVDVRSLQGQLIRLSAQTAKNSLRQIEAYTGSLDLDNMINFYQYDITNRKNKS